VRKILVFRNNSFVRLSLKVRIPFSGKSPKL